MPCAKGYNLSRNKFFFINFQLLVMKKIYTLMLAIVSMAAVTNAQPTVIPATDELILPQYAYFGGNIKTRIPIVCRLRITGLSANSTYRYFTGMSSDATKTTQTPGASYRINNTANAYGNVIGLSVNRSMNGSIIQNDVMYTLFTSPSYYAEFTTDGSGNYTGWFACATTGTASQQDKGANAYLYVQVNNGAGGTTLSKSFRTTSTIHLLDYTSTVGDANGGTALLGTSNVGDEKIVAIYDNVAASGRPLYCTFTENNNCASCTPVAGQLTEATLWTYPTIYSLVDNVSGSWAAIIPNNLPTGVQAINFLDIPTASLLTLSNAPATNTSADGTWNGVATANPAGDSTVPVKINSIQGSLLPVSLLEFKGSAAKEGVKLTWKTTQEINNKYFEISRSGTDGHYRTIGKVNAVANPGLINDYSFVDVQPNSGKNYYQLRQVDKDGSAHVSNTVFVMTGQQNQAIRMISAGSAEILVAITANNNGKGNLMYTDMLGAVLYKRAITLQNGENNIRIPVAGLAKGMGIVSFVSDNGERTSLKVIR